MNIGILNRSTINNTAAKNEVSSFVETNYLSSTEISTLNAWLHNFDAGSQHTSQKNNAYSVRAVRAF